MTVDLSSLCDVQNVLVTLTVCVASGEEVRMDSRSFCAVAFVKVKAKEKSFVERALATVIAGTDIFFPWKVPAGVTLPLTNNLQRTLTVLRVSHAL